MPKKSNVSAGLLLFRRTGPAVEFFLAHPGGPFWKNKEERAWTIPKGIVEEGEVPLVAAIREFREETGIEASPPYIELGSVRQKGGKVVHGWAWEGDADPSRIVSNEARLEWPRNSGRWITYPEVDRCAWFGPAEARRLINAAQSEFIDRLLTNLSKTTAAS